MMYWVQIEVLFHVIWRELNGCRPVFETCNRNYEWIFSSLACKWRARISCESFVSEHILFVCVFREVENGQEPQKHTKQFIEHEFQFSLTDRRKTKNCRSFTTYLTIHGHAMVILSWKCPRNNWGFNAAIYKGFGAKFEFRRHENRI